MKHLKIYEEYEDSDIKIGNYVLLNIENDDNSFIIGLSSRQRIRLKEYLNNSIGEIINKYENYSGNIQIEVKYYNLPFDISNLIGNIIIVHESDIFDVSEEKQDLIDRYKLRQNTNKFNI